jgi:ADP-ribosylglycohydrolase
MTAIHKHDRYRGAMVGLLGGDEIGGPYETWGAAEIAADIDRRGGLTMFDYVSPWAKLLEGSTKVLPKGRPTDDSDHAAALGLSLVEHRRVVPEDIYARLRRITFEHVSPLWNGVAKNAGHTTRTMLRPATLAESQALTVETYPSNGSLMRAAALSLFYGSFEAADHVVIDSVTRITHRHEVVEDCTGAFVATLCNLLEGHDPEYSIKSHIGFSISDHVSMHCDRVTPKDPGTWPARGAATFTLHVAYWSLMHATSYADGIEKAIRVGGDSETYAAVAGALLGARFGIHDIPGAWRKDMMGVDVMLGIADDLYEIAHR